MVSDAHVIIYRTGGGAYADVTDRLVLGGEPVIIRAENRAGSASFRILREHGGVNAITALRWSDDTTSGIQCGMRVRIVWRNYAQLPIFEGIITTISPDEDGTVAVECGDWLAVLGAQGFTYRRNIMGDVVTGTFNVRQGTNCGIVLMNAPGSAYESGEWMVQSSHPWTRQSSTPVQGQMQLNTDGYSITTVPGTQATIHINRIYWSTAAGQTMNVTIDPSLEVNGRDVLAYSRQDVLLTFDSSGYSNSFSINVDIAEQVTVHASGDTIDLDLGVYIPIGNFDWLPEVIAVHIRSEGYWADITAASLDADGNLVVTAIQGQNIADSTLYIPPEGRARITYRSGYRQTASVAQVIAPAAGLSFSGSGPQASITYFRAGGSSFLDILTILAEMRDNSGKRSCFTVVGGTSGQTRTLVWGTRTSVEDTATKAIRYGGDSANGDVFSSFKPILTHKRRPGIVIVKGSWTDDQNEDLPVTVAISAGTNRGIEYESLEGNGSADGVRDQAVTAYSAVMSKTLDRWEGTVVLPGIVLGYISSTGSGAVVAVTDSRYGLSSYKMRAVQVKYDVNTMTTTITLDNYDRTYDNAIGDNASMAMVGVNRAMITDLCSDWNLQYVRLEGQGVPPSQSIQVYDSERSEWVTASESTVIAMPDGHYVVYGRFKSVDVHNTVYPITMIGWSGGQQYTIPEHLRPSFDVDMILEVNLELFPS